MHLSFRITPPRKIGEFEGSIYAFHATGYFPFLLVHCNNAYYKKSIENLKAYWRCISTEFLLGTFAEKPLLKSSLFMSILADENAGINWVYEVAPRKFPATVLPSKSRNLSDEEYDGEHW